MKNLVRKFMVLMLAVSMSVPAASAVVMPQAQVVEAAAKKLTLYVGEQFSVSGVNSIKSANSKIVKAGKTTDGGYVTRFMIAKKTGTTTVTTKSSYGNATTKYKVTVKKNPCKATMKFSAYDSGEVLLSVSNSSSQIFENATVKYTLKTSSGDVFEEKEITVSDILPKKTAYKKISLTRNADVNLDQSTAEVTGVYHNPNRKYTDVSKKVKVKETSVTDTEKETEVIFNIKNTTKSNATGEVYILLKDQNDEVIGMEYSSQYLQKGSTETATKKIYKSYYTGYDHYELVPVFYTSKL